MSHEHVKDRHGRRQFLKNCATVAAAAGVAEGVLKSPATAWASSGQAAQASDEKVVDGICQAMSLCAAVCPLKVSVKDGRITHVTNHPEYHCCVKGHSHRMTVYDPDRLKYPMKRVGERGEGKFERITWDEALDLYAGKIKEIGEKHGNQTILWYPSRGTGGIVNTAPKTRLPNLMGGMLRTWGSLCIANKGAAVPTIYGTNNAESDLDTIKDSNLAIIWGYGFADSNRRGDFAGEGMRIMMDARKNGTRIVVIDPFFCQTAAKADQWIPIKPGTDGAMALAMANVIINQKLQNQEFIDKFVLGFDEFAEHVQQYTPEWAAEITGVPADVITDLAVEFATKQPSALFPGDGPSRSGCDPSQWVRACAALSAITGSLGKPGTNAGSGMAFAKGIQVGDLAAADKDQVKLRVNECQIADAILTQKAVQPSGKVEDCPIHMLVMHGAGPLSQQGDTNKNAKAMMSPELEYIIVADLVMTPTARFADLLLPVATSFERNEAAAYGSAGHVIVYGEQSIEPMYEVKSDLDIWAEVARRLGIGDEFHSDWKDVDWLRETFKISAEKSPVLKGLTLETLQKEKVVFVGERPNIPFQKQVNDGEPFPTKSGKIELFSQDQADKGLPALPTYLDDFENERHPLAAKYPLTIVTPHAIGWLQGRTSNPWIKELFPVEAFINPADAGPRGIKDGDAVDIFNDRGVSRRTAKLSERVPAGVLALPQGPWFQPGADGVDMGGSVNVLTSDAIDRLGGAGTFNAVLVEIKKA